MTSRLRASAAGIALAAAAVAACSRDAATAPKPASVTAGLGAVTAATVGVALTAAPTFIVKDGSGNALGNVAVTVAVTAGGGTLTGAPVKSAAGATAVGTWTLGTVAGLNTVTVTVAGLPAVSINVTGKPDVPGVLTVTSGNSQRVPAGVPVPQPVTLRVADRFGNGVPGATVTFGVVTGGGAREGSPTVTTVADGSVTAPAWVMGRSNVPQQIIASAGNLSVLVNATVATSYVVDLRFFGPAVEPGIGAAFTAAANRLTAEVIGGVAPENLVGFDVVANCPGVTGVGLLTESVPGVIIYATVTTIDGVGGVIGSSGPCIIRSSNQLAIIGVMQFDVADLQTLFNDGRLGDVVFHEMHHVLGFGTVWDRLPLNGTPKLIINAGTPNTAFTGAQAINGCVASGGRAGTCMPTIPLENRGGPGTADGHWRKSVFGAELMTGYISPPGVPNPLSQITIGSMADLGYVVNLNVADSYAIGSAAAFQLGTVRGAVRGADSVLGERLLFPQFEVMPRGGIRRLAPLK